MKPTDEVFRQVAALVAMHALLTRSTNGAGLTAGSREDIAKIAVLQADALATELGYSR